MFDICYLIEDSEPTDQDSLSFAKQDPVTVLRQTPAEGSDSVVVTVVYNSQHGVRGSVSQVASGTRGRL